VVWPAKQRATAGAIVVEQVADECTVFVDGQKWPEGKTLHAYRFVPPGMHTVECRGSSGNAFFSRKLEVAIGRETPLFWGP